MATLAPTEYTIQEDQRRKREGGGGCAFCISRQNFSNMWIILITGVCMGCQCLIMTKWLRFLRHMLSSYITSHKRITIIIMIIHFVFMLCLSMWNNKYSYGCKDWVMHEGQKRVQQRNKLFRRQEVNLCEKHRAKNLLVNILQYWWLL